MLDEISCLQSDLKYFWTVTIAKKNSETGNIGMLLIYTIKHTVQTAFPLPEVFKSFQFSIFTLLLNNHY